MQYFRKFLIEIIGVPIILAWLFFRVPEAFDAAIPWVALVVAMYSDWVNFRRIKQKHAYDVMILKNQQNLVLAEAELENLRAAKKHEQSVKESDLAAERQERLAQFAAQKSINEKTTHSFYFST